jgi:hypothetical protein
MSELLGRAAQLGQEQRHIERERAQRGVIDEARRRAKAEADRRESQRRVAEFVGILASRRVPTMPLYQEIIHKGSNYGNMSTNVIRDRTLRWEHRADGWVVREPSYPYDEEPIRGLFITDSSDYYFCSEPLRTRETGLVPDYVRRQIHTPEFAITDPHFVNVESSRMEPTSARWAPFAGEEGLGTLAHALVRLGIEK